MLAALAGVLALLASKYGELSALFLSAMGKKRAIYAAELIRDAMEGCPDVEIRVHFPYEVEVDCAEGRVHAGGAWADIPACSGGGRGRNVVIKGCRIDVT